jgi:hypothetical protein
MSDPKEDMIYASIYMTFKHRKNQAMADDRNQKNGYLFGKDID